MLARPISPLSFSTASVSNTLVVAAGVAAALLILPCVTVIELLMLLRPTSISSREQLKDSTRQPIRLFWKLYPLIDSTLSAASSLVLLRQFNLAAPLLLPPTGACQ